MKAIAAREFDEKFDNGDDVLAHCDTEHVERPGLKQRRVNVDFPAWMIERLDQEARRLGVARQSLIKFWISDKLKDSVARNR